MTQPTRASADGTVELLGARLARTERISLLVAMNGREPGAQHCVATESPPALRPPEAKSRRL